MPRKAQDVTDAELAVLQVLWDRGEATVREVVDELYPTGTPSDLATVQKLLQRLEEKGCLGRNRNAWPHIFRPAIQRDDLNRRRLQSTADTLCSGSLSPLLTHLVKSSKLKKQDREELRKLLDELDEGRER
jgi:BlaI family transcriptional regulator, penicillinase repressor